MNDRFCNHPEALESRSLGASCHEIITGVGPTRIDHNKRANTKNIPALAPPLSGRTLRVFVNLARDPLPFVLGMAFGFTGRLAN